MIEEATRWLPLLEGPRGVLVLVLAFIVGLVRGWWVMGTHHQEVVTHRDTLQERIWLLLDLTDTAIGTTHTVAQRRVRRARRRAGR